MSTLPCIWAEWLDVPLGQNFFFDSECQDILYRLGKSPRGQPEAEAAVEAVNDETMEREQERVVHPPC